MYIIVYQILSSILLTIYYSDNSMMEQKLELQIYLYANQFQQGNYFGNERCEESESHSESISVMSESSLSKI